MILIVGAWIFYNNKVLLIHHKKSGLWLPVGGHQEEGEKLIEALHREIKEEVGLEVTVLGEKQVEDTLDHVEEVPTPFRVAHYHHKLILDFIAVAHDDAVVKQEEEILDYKWVTLKELQADKALSNRVKTIGKRAFAKKEELL